MEDFKLAILLLPGWDAFRTEIIYERMLAGASTHCQQRTQVFIEQVPFLFKASKTALRFIFHGFFERELVFFGELLRHGDS